MGVDMPHNPRKTLMRSLGEFVGHLRKAAKADVSRERVKVRERTQERIVATDAGELVLRRRTIDEVELRRSAAEPSSPHTPPRSRG